MSDANEMSDAERRIHDQHDTERTLREQLSAAQREVTVWKAEHAKVHGDWMETRKKVTAALADIQRLTRERDEERARTGYWPGCRELIERAEKAEAERDAARALNESQARTIDLLRQHGCHEACVSGQEEAKAARADKRAAMERAYDQGFHRGFWRVGDASKTNEAVANERALDISALEDKP